MDIIASKLQLQQRWAYNPNTDSVARGRLTNCGTPSGSFCPYVNLRPEFREHKSIKGLWYGYVQVS